MYQIDPDGALRLAAAIARQWIREQPHELPAVANWLGVEPTELRRRMMPPAIVARRRTGGRACRGCGAPLPERNGGGRARVWCTDRCRRLGER